MRPTSRQKTKTRRGLLALSLLLTLAAGDPYAYRDRGDRHEGVRAKPVSGYNVELLAAMVHLDEPISTLPEMLAIRFFLENAEEVHVTVREREPEDYYWLDKVRPAEAWRPRTANVFSWPSREVLRPLGLKPSGLLVLARLGRSTPSARERVAPVVFHPTGVPRKIGSYRFTFKTNATAKVRYQILGSESSEPILSGNERRREADIPFDVAWQPGDLREGRYRLLLTGYFNHDNTLIRQEVEFFHAPVWPQ